MSSKPYRVRIARLRFQNNFAPLLVYGGLFRLVHKLLAKPFSAQFLRHPKLHIVIAVVSLRIASEAFQCAEKRQSSGLLLAR